MPIQKVETCVGAIVVEAAQLLLVRRGRGPGEGQWSVPGGRVEPGERLAEAVEREVLEETGLEVRCGRFVGWVERISQDHHFVILDFEAKLESKNAPVAADDASAVMWADESALTSVDLVPGLNDFLDAHAVLPLR